MINGFHRICLKEREKCRNSRHQLKTWTVSESRTSGENTLVSRVRHAKPCTVRAYPLRGFHSAVIINIRVLHASRTDRRRSRLCQARFDQRDASGSVAFYPRCNFFCLSPTLSRPLLRKEVTATRSWPWWRYHCTRETLSSTRRVNFSTAKLARRHEGQNERKRNRGSLRLRLHARSGWFALRRFSYVLSAASALILRRAYVHRAAQGSSPSPAVGASIPKRLFARYITSRSSQGRMLDCIVKMPSRGLSEWPRFIQVESILDCIAMCRMQLIQNFNVNVHSINTEYRKAK